MLSKTMCKKMFVPFLEIYLFSGIVSFISRYCHLRVSLYIKSYVTVH